MQHFLCQCLQLFISLDSDGLYRLADGVVQRIADHGQGEKLVAIYGTLEMVGAFAQHLGHGAIQALVNSTADAGYDQGGQIGGGPCVGGGDYYPGKGGQRTVLP